MSQSDILKRIVDRKKEVVVARKKKISEHQLKEQLTMCLPARGFVNAIQKKHTEKNPAVIAEIKKASPSKGIIAKEFNPVFIANAYAENGAACLSVLTEEDFFLGSDEYLIAARNACALPVLRKDFVVDAYQILESRVMGADCVLLIVSALSFDQLKTYYYLALESGLDVLIEVHNKEELLLALQLNPSLIGINNRNLKTFEVTLNTTFDLLSLIPKETVVVSESGILQKEDVIALQEKDVHTFLVGEAFMKTTHPGQALKALFF